MAKLSRLTSKDAESLLLKAGFVLIKSAGSHRIYIKNDRRIAVPIHSGKILHPKIVKQVFEAIDDTK